MKYLLLIACFATTTLKAQTREELTSQLGTLYNNGEMKKAIPIAQKIIDLNARELGKDHPDYASSLTDLGAIHFALDDYAKAETLIVQAAAIRKKALGEKDLAYAGSLQDMGMIKKATRHFTEALGYYQQANEIWRARKGELSAEFANNLETIADIYRETSDLPNAESSSIFAAAIWKLIAGELSNEMAANLYNRSMIYYYAALYVQAGEAALETARLRKALGQEKSSDYANCLSVLAMSYLRLGKYEKAEPLFLEALNLEHSLGNENNYASALTNLATLYQSMGQFKKAQPLLLEVCEIKKRTSGVDHEEYATALDVLAVVYGETEEYEKAETISKQALAIRKKIFTGSHPLVAFSLHNLAAIYALAGKNTEAEKYFLQAIAIRKKLLGEEHPDYANSISSLASVYCELKRFKEAEDLLIKTLAINKKSLGTKHPDYAAGLNNLALLYSVIGDFTKAEDYMMKSNKIMRENVTNSFDFLSENEKAEYLENRIWILDENNSMLYNHPAAGREFVRHSYEQLLFFKSLLLSDSKNMLKMVRESKDTALATRFELWTSLRKKLSLEYGLPVNERSKQLGKMEKDAEEYEKLLMYRSSGFRKQQASLQFTAEDVRRSLQPGEAAIEFVRFDLFNKTWTDSTIYAAYILRQEDSVPVFVSLCEERQLQKLLDSAGRTPTTRVEKLYGRAEKKNGGLPALGIALHKLVWSPLEPYLKGIKKVSYAPAGKLYDIAFPALPVDSNRILKDQYILGQYISTRDIVGADSSNSTPKSIALFGGALFSMDSTQIVKQSKPARQKDFIDLTASIDRAFRDSVWQELPATITEVRDIQQLFEKNSISTAVYTGVNASEYNLKALSGTPASIVHVATHGFSLKPPVRKRVEQELNAINSYVVADDPLLRSGLVLSGANYAWSGRTPVPGAEDGIVSAYEISQLDFTNTELVVLSACETALGDVRGNEGVFGLQRAFKMAGVKKMIVSLWRVPDKETAELMTDFYQQWLQTGQVEKAFELAQSAMRKKYPAYYWAAFVLVH